jgi:hypothetical protein
VKDYPKIPGPNVALSGKGARSRRCIAFDKLDGSNIRCEWNPKSGWYKFATRTRLFDHTDPDFGGAIDLFLAKYGDQVVKAVQVVPAHRKVTKLIAFAEYFGPHSFAGQHDPVWLGVESNEPKDLVLFDINVNKSGFMSPHDFVRTFGHLHIPRVVYEGPFDEEFIRAVRNGSYPVVEGVIAKGGERHSLWMRKVKVLKYLQKLRERFGTDWQKYGE